MARILSTTTRHVSLLHQGWELTATPPGAVARPAELGGVQDWIPAPVPGTAAQALRDAGRWTLDTPAPLHDQDFWYRLRFEGDGERTLRFHGLATLAEVWLNGERLLSSDGMFTACEAPATLTGTDELFLCFRALHPALQAKRGRARWRPRMIEPGTLRFVRTTLLGHMTGWCPPVHAIGPWRPVECIEHTGPPRVHNADLRATLDGRDGVLDIALTLDQADPPPELAFVHVGSIRAPLVWDGIRRLHGTVRIANVTPWWPHTHGEPALYPVQVEIGPVRIDLGRTGFRSIAVDRGADGNGFALVVNSERVFCRGACWTPVDIVALPGTREAYRPGLELMRKAGMNMVRVGGTMVYESDDFFALCDELGLLVWQDFMFANFDYPADEAFLGAVRAEAAQFLDRTQASPSLAVLCGGSEAKQQSAMLGLPPAAWSQPVFHTVLAEESARARPDAVYVTNSPSGGPLPFLANVGVTHYYGVSAYLRPLDDARRAEVRFASECLAFANVPEAQALAALGPNVVPVHHPKWKERVPRDVGAPWDFEDVREHYLRTLYNVDPLIQRYEDPDRYLRLSRAVTGDVMEAVFNEWRRGRSSCAGGLVWLFRDLWPGVGWGVVDSRGVPKAAWHALRRAFRPVQVMLSDEGVNGLAVHLLNETAHDVHAILTLTALRQGSVPVRRIEHPVTVPARGALELPAAAVSAGFFDMTYAYRFGPCPHDVAVATLTDAAGGARLADAFHFPQGRPLDRVDLGLTVFVERSGDDWLLRLRSSRLAFSVHVEDEAFLAEEEWFHLPPGTDRTVRLVARHDRAARPNGEVHALNGLSPIRFKA
ncbi:MAG TPA: glycoside hydrolase family 2 protein [Azospirillum sp.]|nr:glycoside hydrolase family 2 protein [Azospirillum sp.]